LFGGGGEEGEEDDLAAFVEEDGFDGDLADGGIVSGLGRQESEISEIPESEPEDLTNVDIPFEEEQLKTAEKLDFSNVSLSGAQARRVAALIAENSSLTTIQFDGHELPIGELSEDDPELELEWDSEEFTDVEAIIIAEILKNGKSTVTRLDLARNQITDDGAKALAEMLVSNTTLEYLNLESNMISEKGGMAFGRAMVENETLQYLNLKMNSISSSRQQELRDKWSENGRGRDVGLHL